MACSINWLKWSRKAEKLFIYSNSLRAMHALPTVISHRLGEDLRFYADHKITGKTPSDAFSMVD